MESCFVGIKTSSSFCPNCNSTVVLLTPKVSRGPAFYICCNCCFIAEVGVGPVTITDPDESPESESLCEHLDSWCCVRGCDVKSKAIFWHHDTKTYVNVCEQHFHSLCNRSISQSVIEVSK